MAVCTAALVSCKDDEIIGTNDGDGFFLNRTELSLNRGASEALVATVTPKGAAQVSWSSADPSVATVSAEGLVTATGAGETIITAKAGSHSLDCKVSVTSLVTAVNLDNTAAELWYNDEIQLSATAGPEDINVAMDTVWTSSNDAVATVTAKGLVKAVGGGNATIAVQINGVSATCDVNVRRNPEGVAIDAPDDKVSVGRTLQLTGRLTPDDATEELPFSWASSDDAIATVDGNGLVTGVAAGTAEITLTAGSFSVSKTITVKNPQQVSVSLTSATSPYTSGDVTFTLAGDARWGGNNYGVEFHTGSSVTISVPAGSIITQIRFTNTYGSRDFTVNTGSYSRSGSNHMWVPTTATNSVTFTNNNAEIDVKTFTINYE